MTIPEDNPFASPITPSIAPPGMEQAATAEHSGGLWQEQSILVAHNFITERGSAFPDRCVKCNAPANGRRHRLNLSWHSPLVYLIILVGVIFYIIVALIVRKQSSFQVGICDYHAKRRRMVILIAWLIAFSGIGAFVLAIAYETPVLFLISPLALVAAGIVGIYFGSVLTAKKIDREYSWLKGAGPEFLAELPPSF